MSASSPAAARAAISCRRCNRRKKKCDKRLPACEMCSRANIPCSFLESDRLVGSYPVIYVQNLEDRVRNLERQLATSSTAPEPPSIGISGHANPLPYVSHPQNRADTDGEGSDSHDVSADTGSSSLNHSTVPGLTSEAQLRSNLGDNLKSLATEAAAERYVGPSSGLLLAQITQSILRQLSPDKADFVFGGDNEDSSNNTLSALGNESHPFDILEHAAVSELGPSSRYDKSLFGGVSLSNFMQDEADISSLCLPDQTHAETLVKFYFAHSHSLYPIVRQNAFRQTLEHIYQDPDDTLSQSPLWQFRVWMVLAIGSTAHHTVTLEEESESAVYYNKAMSYFDSTLKSGDLAVLETLLLQISYSFFSLVGPNTWFLVGIAARVAVGIGLHTSTTYSHLSVADAEHRKRLLYSLYMMDRVVSIALGRPFAINDNDIDVAPFRAVDDNVPDFESTTSENALDSSIMAIPLHILALRQIATEISSLSNTKRFAHLSIAERDEVIEKLHKRLIDWRRNMPFPLPDTDAHVPHHCSSWFDYNYHTHLLKLYQPSILLTNLDVRKLGILRSASALAIREAMNLYRQQRFAFNWLNLLAVFNSTMSLVYAVVATRTDLAQTVRESSIIEDIGLTIELLDAFAKKFNAARGLKHTFTALQRTFQAL